MPRMRQAQPSPSPRRTLQAQPAAQQSGRPRRADKAGRARQRWRCRHWWPRPRRASARRKRGRRRCCSATATAPGKGLGGLGIGELAERAQPALICAVMCIVWWRGATHSAAKHFSRCRGQQGTARLPQGRSGSAAAGACYCECVCLYVEDFELAQRGREMPVGFLHHLLRKNIRVVALVFVQQLMHLIQEIALLRHITRAGEGCCAAPLPLSKLRAAAARRCGARAAWAAGCSSGDLAIGLAENALAGRARASLGRRYTSLATSSVSRS